MLTKCRCGVTTNYGKNCSRCQDLEISIMAEIDWNVEELELVPENIDQEVLDFIENFKDKKKT